MVGRRGKGKERKEEREGGRDGGRDYNPRVWKDFGRRVTWLLASSSILLITSNIVRFYHSLLSILVSPLLIFVIVVDSLSHVRLSATTWAAEHQASLSFTNSQNLLKLLPIKSAMASNHLPSKIQISTLPFIFISHLPVSFLSHPDHTLLVRHPSHFLLLVYQLLQISAFLPSWYTQFAANHSSP